MRACIHICVICRLILFFLVSHLGEKACGFLILLTNICFFNLFLVLGLNEMLSSAICTWACFLPFKARGHDKDVAKFLKFSSKPKTICMFLLTSSCLSRLKKYKHHR